MIRYRRRLKIFENFLFILFHVVVLQRYLNVKRTYKSLSY